LGLIAKAKSRDLREVRQPDNPTQESNAGHSGAFLIGAIGSLPGQTR